MLPSIAKACLGAITLVAAALLGAPVAASDPEIPDLSVLPRASQADFFGPGSYTYAFRAGQDVWCSMSYSRFSNHSSCAGRLPGVSNGENYASVYWEMLNHTGNSQIMSSPDMPPKPDQQHFYQPLPPGHVLWIGSNYEVGTHACGAPPGYLLVCRIDAKLPDQPPQSHGFVLSESGSWTF
ncbi:hypothetical protein [Mycobacteroides franklinii]|nr:hypothetical protein [Mycobacteroides franklinii]